MLILVRVFAIGCIAAGLSHVALGLGADVLLGAVPADALQDATLDSQNRFYGATFTVYGALSWLFTTDPARHAPMFRVLMALFFAGGLARLVSIAHHGLPSSPVLVLLATELLLPPLFLSWTRRLSS